VQIYNILSLNTGIVNTSLGGSLQEMDIKQIVGNNIKFIRHKRDMTLDDLSILTGMSRTYINDVELGKNAITVVRLEMIAKALKVKPSILLEHNGYKTLD
jgi:DNA-binding Xre family transcriptional regulator